MLNKTRKRAVKLNVTERRDGLGGDREEIRRNPIDMNIGVRACQVLDLGKAENKKITRPNTHYSQYYVSWG